MMKLHTKEIAFINAKVAELNTLKAEVKKFFDAMQAAKGGDYETFKRAYDKHTFADRALWNRAKHLEDAFCISLDMLGGEITIASDIEEMKTDKENLISYYLTKYHRDGDSDLSLVPEWILNI